MSKANGSGGDDLQAAFLLDEEEASAKPNGSGQKAAPAKRGKRIKAEAQPESARETPAAEPAAEAVSAPATEAAPPVEAGAEPGSESTEAPAAPEAGSEVQGPRVMRYGNDEDGCWVEFEDGTRESISEEGWINALARHFKRESTATG